MVNPDIFLIGAAKAGTTAIANWMSENPNIALSKIKEPNLLNYLDLVSLGTVCDVVPLIGLNRALVKQGLKILKSKKNLGIKT